MVRIDYFSVKGYKNIADAEVTFNNFNVIIGPNNAGKSNFLQSISFLDLIINGATDETAKYFDEGFYRSLIGNPEPVRQLDNDEFEKEGSIDFVLMFSNSDTNTSYYYSLQISYIDIQLVGISFKISSESLEVKEKGKPGKAIRVFEREGNAVKYGASLPKMGFETAAPFLSVIGILKVFPVSGIYTGAIQSLTKVLKTPTFYFSNTELLKSDESARLNVFNGRTIAFNLADEIIKLNKTDKWDIFTAAIADVLGISKAYVFSYQRMDNSSPINNSLFFEQYNTRKTIQQFSDGSILILALITKVLNSDHDIFFIEEPENSTHPKALVDLIAFLQSFSETKQFVITSHSIAILNKTKIDDIITSVIGKNGLSEFRNVKSQKELKVRLKSSHVNFSDELFFNTNEEEFE